MAVDGDAERALQQPRSGPFGITRVLKTLKSDRGLNLGARMTSNNNKPIKNHLILKVQLNKAIENEPK